MRSMNDQLHDSATLKRVRRIHDQLYEARLRYESKWRKLSKYINPSHGRFHEESGGREGENRNFLMDSYPVTAHKRCAAGLYSGLTSPAVQWFKLNLVDKEKSNYHTFKVWLNEVQKTMNSIYARGNTYNMLYNCDSEITQFGTCAAMMYENFNTGIWHKQYTCGEYALGTDLMGRVNKFARRMEYNAEQLIREFGMENVSKTVQNAYKNNDLNSKFRVNMLVEENIDYDPYKLEMGNFPWKSWYWEDSQQNRFLRISGYREQPFIAARWEVVADDIYGVGPGHDIIGDCMQLQKVAENEMRGVDNQNDPAMVYPSSIAYLDTRPGAKNKVPDGTVTRAYPLIDPASSRSDGMARVEDKLYGAINRGFYTDLMAMMTSRDDPRMTATEVAERHQEKLLLLGPVLEQMHSELLKPLTKRMFGICLRNGLIPPPPDGINPEEELGVDFDSLLASAQKLAAQPAIAQTLAEVGNLAGISPEVVDNFNMDKAARELADSNGAPETILRSEDEVEDLRKQRAEAQAQQQQMENAAAMATPMRESAAAARLLSETRSDDGRSVLDTLMGGM